MKTNLIFSAALMLTGACAAFVSCNKELPSVQDRPEDAPVMTKAYGDKSPIVSVYVEINDNDPRIVTSYKDGNNKAFVDLVHLFASNIHADSDGYPAIYFNDKMAPMFENYQTYIPPIQAQGTKVLLTVLGDWDHIGVANLTPAQADRFADILVYIVDTYNLDGISFDDEYADYYSTLSGSYSHVIKALHAKLDARFGVGTKLVTVFQWGNYGQIDSEAGAMLDYADHGTFNILYFATSSSISGMTNDRWMPLSIQLGQSYTAIQLNQIRSRSAQAASGGYGGIMMFNMRRYSDVSPLPVFQAIAQGAFNGTVTYDGSDYVRNWATDPDGHTITKDDVPSYTPQYTGN